MHVSEFLFLIFFDSPRFFFGENGGRRVRNETRARRERQNIYISYVSLFLSAVIIIIYAHHTEDDGNQSKAPDPSVKGTVLLRVPVSMLTSEN